MCRRSFSDVATRHGSFQYQIFPAVKQGLMLAQGDGNCTHLNQLDARNLLVVSVSRINEEQVLYSP
jgi:hypothetical protein